MMGNSSSPLHIIAVYTTLALHAAITSHRCGVVAGKASDSLDEHHDSTTSGNNNYNSQRRKHLRRQQQQLEDYSIRQKWRDDQDGGNLSQHTDQNQHIQREEIVKDSIESTRVTSSQSVLSIYFDFDINDASNKCMNRKWYQDFTNPKQLACTNSLDYPSSWDDPSLRDIVMFDSSKACCNSLIEFMGDQYNNNDNYDGTSCLTIDECEESSPLTTELISSSLPASSTIKQHRRKLGCGELGFHPSTFDDGKGCTNDDQYPPSWLQPQLKTRMFHPAWEACCQFFFKGNYEDCPVKDACTGEEFNTGNNPKTSDAASVSTEDDKKKPKPSSQQQQNSKPNKAPSPSSKASTECTNKWHVDMVNRDGCSNDNIYPKEWLDPSRKHLMFFDKPEDCCSVMFSGQKDRPACKHNYSDCKDDPNMNMSMNQPRPPRPPPRRTPPPTPVPKVYWIEETTGTCLDEEDVPRPHWIDTTYSVYEACCRDARDPTACKNAAPVDPNAPTRPPVMKPFSFYVDPSTGMCVEESEMSKPAWITATYPVYELCCSRDEGVRDRELCMKARPTEINGVSFGTVAPTSTPEPKYFADPGTGMCVDEATKPMPSHIAMTFDTLSRCCLLASSNPEICLTGKHLEVVTSDTDTESTGSPTPAPLPDYYLQQDTAICVDLNSVQNPGWVDKTFGTDYDKCCDTSWNKQKCMEMKPSMAPSDIPTWAPSTPWPTYTSICPEPYDPLAGDYERGSEVEVNMVIYKCIGHAVYCNKQEFQPPQTDPGPTVTSGTKTGGVITSQTSALWEDAWERVAICVYPPTPLPSGMPTSGMPTCHSARWHPEAFDRRICTNGFGYPTLWDEPPLSETYFVDSAEECCDKFYGGTRCRIKDICS